MQRPRAQSRKRLECARVNTLPQSLYCGLPGSATTHRGAFTARGQRARLASRTAIRLSGPRSCGRRAPPKGGQRQAAGPLTENLPNVCACDRGAIGASQKIPSIRGTRSCLYIAELCFAAVRPARIQPRCTTGFAGMMCRSARTKGGRR